MTLSASSWWAGAEMHTGREFVITAASSGTCEFVDKFQEADDVASTPPISVTAEVNINQRGGDIIGDLPS